MSRASAYVISENNNQIMENWLSTQNLAAPVSSNVGARNLPFQRWFKFKEAYAPAFVVDSVERCNYPVNHILDPFGGCGTTALTARMMGLNSTSIEVNPFLADVIRAKVTKISPSSFAEACNRIVEKTRVVRRDYTEISGAPATLIEPGVNNRYVYARETYGALRALHRRIQQLETNESRLARVLLGSILVESSNVRIDGKGRRYRQNWQADCVSREQVFERFHRAVTIAVQDLSDFGSLTKSNHHVYTGDARVRLKDISITDLVVFSPPYPNSFDYTDVYNLELWMLGYFCSASHTRKQRSQTLRSHVQIKWPPGCSTEMTPTLREVKNRLDVCRLDLWNRNIPEMVVGYFSDLERVLRYLHRILRNGCYVVAAVGDSQYGGVRIETARILEEISERCGFDVEDSSRIRSMRVSSQHGGRLGLSETALRIKRREMEYV